RLVRAAAFDREDAQDRSGVERVRSQTVERVGADGDDAAIANPRRRLLDRIALRRPWVDEHAPHRDISLWTAAASALINARSTKNTARMLVPPSAPATNGLLAMPMSDALVRTPKPVPCAPAGITLPAALYDAVIAAPMPMPKIADAALMLHTLP